jgi:hypothetical protein
MSYIALLRYRFNTNSSANVQPVNPPRMSVVNGPIVSALLSWVGLPMNRAVAVVMTAANSSLGSPSSNPCPRVYARAIAVMIGNGQLGVALLGGERVDVGGEDGGHQAALRTMMPSGCSSPRS